MRNEKFWWSGGWRRLKNSGLAAGGSVRFQHLMQIVNNDITPLQIKRLHPPNYAPVPIAAKGRT